MADAWGGSWGSSWGVSWGSGGTPPAPSPSTGGGGGGRHYQPSSGARKRYREYAQHLVARRTAIDADDDLALESAWNRAHGISIPEVVEVPAAIERVVQEIVALPENPRNGRVKAKRRDLMAVLAGKLADYRRELERQALELEAEDEEDAVMVLLLSI